MLHRLYSWYGKSTVITFAVVLAILLVAGIFFSRSQGAVEIVEEIQLRSVTTATVAELSGSNFVDLIGSVEAIDRANIESEISGRVTAVPVALGDRVVSGQVLAQIENATEQASLLLSEGAYEAALAAAARSDSDAVSAENTLKNAEDSAINIYRSTFTTVDDLVRNKIDEVFLKPESNLPGLRIGGYGDTPYLNSERVVIEGLLNAWVYKISEPLVRTDAQELLSEALEYVDHVARFTNRLVTAASNSGNDDSIVDTISIDTYRDNLTTVRSSLNALRASILSSQTTLENAEESLLRARISSQNNVDISASDAQVKQALGALRIAQAAFNKTIIRSPIAGTVNALAVKAGDFVGARSSIAEVANNNALEITTYVGESDRSRIAQGDKVSIEGSIEGRIAHIAPAVNSVTKKIEVKIQTDSSKLQNGDTVQLRIEGREETALNTGIIRIPLTAVKLAAESAYVFTVEDNVLRAHEVTLGRANGAVVTITDGLTFDMVIVVDARGLNDGARVNLTD